MAAGSHVNVVLYILVRAVQDALDMDDSEVGSILKGEKAPVAVVKSGMA